MPTLRAHRPLAAIAVLAALAFVCPDAAEARCANARAQPDTHSAHAIGRATVCLLNWERKRRALRALRINSHLSRAALSHTRDMVEQRYFSHVSRTGLDLTDRVTAAGYLNRSKRWEAGENLALGIGHSATPRSIVARWIKSPSHRRNILDRRFREVGIGVIKGSGRTATAAAYTTTFGYRR